MVVYYRKIPKIFQRPFLRGLFLDVVIFGGGLFNKEFFASLVWGAYIWRGLFLEFYGILIAQRKVNSCLKPALAQLAALIFNHAL